MKTETTPKIWTESDEKAFMQSVRSNDAKIGQTISQLNASVATPKQAAIDQLKAIRALVRVAPRDNTREWLKIVADAVIYCRHIGATFHESELWTNGCTESELNEQSTIGDHLAVTRRALGLLA